MMNFSQKLNDVIDEEGLKAKVTITLTLETAALAVATVAACSGAFYLVRSFFVDKS